MARPSVRSARRAELTAAFARVLAQHGYAGATIAAVAEEAGVAPGLVHHHFRDKGDLLRSLLEDLVARFRRRTGTREATADGLVAYLSAALDLDEGADPVSARCWVGVLAEAVRRPDLFEEVRRLLDTEVEGIRRRSRGNLTPQDAGALLAFVVGALVMGAFAPRRLAGFAGPAARRLAGVLQSSSTRARE
jgi:TetR/AcrR family transcriptional repressor of bet genes